MPVNVWIGALIGALATGLGRIIAAIPALLGAILILLIGWGIGKLIQALVTRGLRALHFNVLTERAGINDALERADIKVGPSAILGIIAYWFIFLLAVQAAVEVLGIAALSTLMATVVLYLPRIFVALLILVVGAWVASLLARLTRSSASAANISYASVLGSIVQGAVLFFTFAIALDTLGLSFPFLTTAFAIVIGGLALAAAVAFGLGGREYASDVLAGRELRSAFSNGDMLRGDNIEGTVTDIRPTYTVLRTTGGDMAIQNSDLMHRHVVKTTGSMGGDAEQRPKAA